MKTNKGLHFVGRLFVVFGLLFTSLPLTSNAKAFWIVSPQDPQPVATPSPTPDAELERLKRETALSNERAAQAENDKKIAEAQKAELEARFPKPSTSPLAGTTTISEGAVIESQIISYRSLRNAADKIVDNIREALITVKNTNRNLAVFNERDVNLILSYRVADAQIAIIENGYKSLMKPTPTPTPPGPGAPKGALRTALSATESFLGAFVDLTALLRTNVDIKGQTFVIDEAPLAAEIFRAAREPISVNDKSHKIAGALYYPYVFPVDVYSTTDSTLLKHLEDTRELRVLAEKLFDDLVKTVHDLGEANVAVKTLKQSVKETIPKQTTTTVLKAANIIKANCPALNNEAEEIKNKPEDQQGQAMIDLIEDARHKCRRMNRNKLEELLGLGDTLKELSENLAEAKTKLGKAEKAQKDLTTKLLELESKLQLGSIADATDLDEITEHADAAIARLTAINAQFDSLVHALITTEAGSANLLTNYIRTERLIEKITVDDYWLQLKVINAGGNNRIKTNLIVDIFRGGNRVSHSGGVIVQYHLFNSEGQSIRSGTVSDYTSYIDAKKIK